MDIARDAHGDPWRESMERSLARRRSGRRPRSGAPKRPDVLPSYWQLCWRSARSHGLTLVAAGAGILSIVLLALVRPSLSDGQSVRVVPARFAPAHKAADRAVAVLSGDAEPCGRRASGYVNPLASASVTPKRIDQGVDYAGSGTLSAMGDGVITDVALSATGWPGAFIEYQLRSGPEAGCYVFYAEGVTPAPGLAVGEVVRRGQALAVIDPTNSAGIEIGWGAGEGTRTYAGKAGQWSAQAEDENIPTSAGLNFSALIATLGGPPGKVERRTAKASACAPCGTATRSS